MRSLVRFVTACASQLARVRVRLVAFRHRSRFATGRVSQQVALCALSRSLLLQREER